MDPLEKKENLSEEPHVHGPNCSHDHVKPKPFVHSTPKIGRNDPCACGSKIKYKKCCGKN
jgi:uncharacterized protein YecA (UPF0149 family)